MRAPCTLRHRQSSRCGSRYVLARGGVLDTVYRVCSCSPVQHGFGRRPSREPGAHRASLRLAAHPAAGARTATRLGQASRCGSSLDLRLARGGAASMVFPPAAHPPHRAEGEARRFRNPPPHTPRRSPCPLRPGVSAWGARDALEQGWPRRRERRRGSPGWAWLPPRLCASRAERSADVSPLWLSAWRALRQRCGDCH